MRVVTFLSGCEPRTTVCLQCLLRLPRLRILVAVLHQLLRLTHQLHHQVNLFLCRITTLWHRHFQGLSQTRFLRCCLPFGITVAGTQTWSRRLVLSSRPRIQHSLRHPRAPLLPALRPSLQVPGTLVVPSFISTYSTLGGPSVVSTLPALSAKPLPIGGSYGGVIVSVSSTFPSLYKAFVVGPGYAPDCF